MSVDVRTRVDGEQVPIDPDRFFGDDLPTALHAAAPLLDEARAVLRLLPMVVEVDSASWTLQVEEAGIVVRPGSTTSDGASDMLSASAAARTVRICSTLSLPKITARTS